MEKLYLNPSCFVLEKSKIHPYVRQRLLLNEHKMNFLGLLTHIPQEKKKKALSRARLFSTLSLSF